MSTESHKTQEAEDIRQKVRAGYSAIAKSQGPAKGAGCCGPAPSSSSCCSSSAPNQLAQAVGYSEAELATLPEGANMGLSCGNPTALASLKPGEVVVDLGSGGGFDVFIAGQKVGAGGRVIGVDMTPDMISKARRNIAAYQERTGLDNVEFRLGEIEHLPVADASADVVISNCVLNLSPDKSQVWREISRVLKFGGRAAISDLALLKPLPAAVREMIEALVGCVAGAVLIEDTERMIRESGLSDAILEKRTNYIESMAEWHDPLYQKIIAHLGPGESAADYITSLAISVRKPISS